MEAEQLLHIDDDLQSTMVRLRPSSAWSSPRCCLHLQSTMVRLRLKYYNIDENIVCNLQSTMVRLRRLLQDVLDAAALKFTIHYGEIKTDFIMVRCSINVQFTIHYGEIKTRGC